MGERMVPAWKVARRVAVEWTAMIVGVAVLGAAIWYGLQGAWWLWSRLFRTEDDAAAWLFAVAFVGAIVAMFATGILSARDYWRQTRRELEGEAALRAKREAP